MKVLFLVPYPTEGASNRVRVEQYLPYLRRRGIRTRVRPFINRPFYRILYLPGRYLEKAFWFCVCTFNRFLDIIRALAYDVVFVHREAYPFGGPFVESLLRFIGKPIIFDFDDAIFLPNTSRENRYIDRLKRPNKTARIIAMSAAVIAGNKYLADFAKKHNSAVTVIPSAVDTERYIQARERPETGRVVIGWIGSTTTRDFLPLISDALVEIIRRHNNVNVAVIGAKFRDDRLGSALSNREWSLNHEVSDLQGFDIGIMPLPDNEWGRGKCGFKAILYMACGVPVVASPVGANRQIIEDGVTGLLATTTSEWVTALERLILDPRLRTAMGQKGRERVIERYSRAVCEKALYETLVRVGAGAKKMTL